jgi:hypothetical protein
MPTLRGDRPSFLDKTMIGRVIRVGAAITLAGAALLAAAIEGRVVSGRGTAVEHARVVLAGGETAFSGPNGEFSFPHAAPPAELTVSHPRFNTRRVEAAEDGVVEIVLEAKQEYFEEIAVSANRGEENFSPVSVAADVLRPEESTAPPGRLTELVAELPGVAENGQGGIFQTYSIRGVSRLRVLTLIAGMRIVGERRAGVSASLRFGGPGWGRAAVSPDLRRSGGRGGIRLSRWRELPDGRLGRWSLVGGRRPSQRRERRDSRRAAALLGLRTALDIARPTLAER